MSARLEGPGWKVPAFRLIKDGEPEAEAGGEAGISLRARCNAVQYVAYVCSCPRMSNIPVSLAGLYLQGPTCIHSAGVIHHLLFCSPALPSSLPGGGGAAEQDPRGGEARAAHVLLPGQHHRAVPCCAVVGWDVHRRALGLLVSCSAHAARLPSLTLLCRVPGCHPLPLPCQVCHKQYQAAHEMEEHLSSYDHHHRKRLAETRAMLAERT